MRGECIKFISLSFSLVSFQKLYFELARIALRANTIMFFTFGFQFVYSTLYMAIGRARQSLLLNIGRQGLFFIPIILLLPSYWELNGVLYAQPIADVFATLMTLFFAVRIHKEIGHKSHLTTENLQC
jgi:Na+-driven multidrug efflux pump